VYIYIIHNMLCYNISIQIYSTDTIYIYVDPDLSPISLVNSSMERR
jgi:hypothetical protein